MADEKRTNRSHGEHTDRCYWDYQECRWVCRHEVEPVAAAAGVGAREEQPCTS